MLRRYTGAVVRAMTAILIAGAAGATTAAACTCPPAPNAASQAEEWDLLAVGTVVAVDNDETGNSASIAVSELLKGDAAETITVTSGPSNPRACGLSYGAGSNVTVLANEAEDGSFNNYFCAIPQFSANEFRVALGHAPVDVPGMATITSPKPGDVLSRSISIEGVVPHDWFADGAVEGSLILLDGAVADVFPIKAVEEDWETPGDKTIDSAVFLNNQADLDVIVQIAEANPVNPDNRRAVSIPIRLLAVPANSDDIDKQQVIHTTTVEWLGYYMENDAGGLDAFLDDEFVLIGADGSVSTKADEVAFLREDGWVAPVDYQYHVDDVILITPAVAFVYGHATSTRAGANGQPCQHVSSASNVLKSNGETWRPISTHVSGVSCTPIE
ncbi:MAG: nuclear transport factor 2 family protein [Pseudomonadota bacterium]